MHVVLIYLPHPYLNQPDAQAPIGLMYLAAVLEEAGNSVELKNYSSALTHEAIADLPEADVYGITVTSLELPQANRFAHLMRERYPDRPILLGGPGTYSYDHVNWDVIDAVCVGDGERTVLEMLNDIKNRSLRRVYHGEAVGDLDTVPLPARHLLDRQGGNIFAYNKNYYEGGSTIILSSRGCPFQCAFCSAPHFSAGSRRMRYRSPRAIYNEMKHVRDTYGIRQFRFSDDMFTTDRQRVLDICRLIEKLDIVWRISCSTKPFDEYTARAMFDAGCKELSFGVESFDNQVLRTIKKHTTAEDNARALEIAHKVGFVSRVLFMIRTPGQRRETVSINIEWLKRVPYNIIACTLYMPLPGSDMWLHPEKYGIEIADRNLDHYNFYFFGRQGENEIRDVIRFVDRDMAEVNEETRYFRDWIKETGMANKG